MLESKRIQNTVTFQIYCEIKTAVKINYLLLFHLRYKRHIDNSGVMADFSKRNIIRGENWNKTIKFCKKIKKQMILRYRKFCSNNSQARCGFYVHPTGDPTHKSHIFIFCSRNTVLYELHLALALWKMKAMAKHCILQDFLQTMHDLPPVKIKVYTTAMNQNWNIVLGTFFC